MLENCNLIHKWYVQSRQVALLANDPFDHILQRDKLSIFASLFTFVDILYKAADKKKNVSSAFIK